MLPEALDSVVVISMVFVRFSDNLQRFLKKKDIFRILKSYRVLEGSIQNIVAIHKVFWLLAMDVPF